MERSPIYFDLIESFEAPGCAICKLALRDVHRHLDSLLYEYVNVPDTNDAFRASRGLCNEHSWQLREFRGMVLGVSILYEAALDEVVKTIDQTTVTAASRLARLFGAHGEQSAAHLADSLEPEAACSACQILEQGEARTIQLLSQYVGDKRLEHAYRASEGLCLPHFRLALRAASGTERADLILSIQRELWGRLRDELNLFITKYDVHNATSPIGDEGTSWQRTIARMAGERGVFGLRREK